MNAAARTPIAENLWRGEPPQLVGGRHRDSGEVVFPVPPGEAGEAYERIALPRTGKLWSWTRQDFRPKSPPYAGPETFTPFLLGYVDLGNVIVESRLEGAGLEDLRLGQAMELIIVPFGEAHTTFAFQPAEDAR
ncbi:Zn-ribbon domain-containing OB-fold protein [Erythrobacter sp.]|jgi:uncharacterized OB-fold protein|uniref:Zn-ribbon domain-containing OB-fold protein n=1 Tax=Erythrobacter sp. TaxID=1042 RepID=UPI002EA2E733|nr:OB-fold domain-containing protein [Erythrobacter sp.]